MEKKPKIKLWYVLTSFIFMITFMLIGILYLDADPHVPMFIGVIVAAIIALFAGFKWDKLEKMMIAGISKAMQTILILVVVGMLIGIWIMSGTIPSMIYYGLLIIKPEIFLVSAMVICTITSLVMGTSWGTMGTIGLAIMGIGAILNVPVGPTAGAVICGSYFGDKMSPLSGSANLSATMAGTDVFSNIKYMIKPTLVAFVIVLIFYCSYAYFFPIEASTISSVGELMDDISSIFFINPILLLPPLVVVFAMAIKIPALPGIAFGAIAGAILAVIFQSDLSVYDADGNLLNVGVQLSNILATSKDGFFLVSENELLNSLLTTGGIMSMSSAIMMIIIAMMFGGIMEGTGMLDILIRALVGHVKSDLGLVAVTELTCITSNVVMPDQTISILIPGRMFSEEYKKRGIHPKCLSNAIQSSSTVTSPLVPWNTCSLYINTTLGVSPFGAGGYFLWAIFNWIVPLVNLVMAALKITITKMTKEQQKLADAGEIVS